MSSFIIKGGNKLSGTVRVNGAKNSVVALIAAAMMFKGEVILENVPKIRDVLILLDIISQLGAKVEWLKDEEDSVLIEVPDTIETAARYEQVRSMRASNLLLGSLLGRRGHAEVSLPGGCDLGSRPMDLHIKGLSKLGAEIEIKEGYIWAVARKRMEGNLIYLDFPSVGATENIMMAACLAEGHTVIENVAKEPEIVDLANFLNGGGAKVRGAGTDIIRIEGVDELKSTRHAVIPDRIEAGSYMAMAAMTGGQLKIENVISAHLKPVIAKMREAGVTVRPNGNAIYIKGPERIKAVDIKTLAYPGFPTDMQPPAMSMLTVAEGTSVIVENLFESRMKAAPELLRMGADIKVEGQTAIVRGVETLSGASVRARDLRAGAALIGAALVADGESQITGIDVIDRGYFEIEKKLQAIGADISRVD